MRVRLSSRQQRQSESQKTLKEGRRENAICSSHRSNLPDESYPQIEVDNILLGLRNDVHQLVLCLIDPLLHLIYIARHS